MDHLIVFKARAFVGTTWVTAVLDSHPGVLAIGNPRRGREKLIERGAKSCVVHRDRCELWPGFLEDFDPDQDFFDQVRAYVPHQTLAMTNPPPELVERLLADSTLKVSFIETVRDARAVIASTWRKRPDKTLQQVLRERRPEPMVLPSGVPVLRLHNEALREDPMRLIAALQRLTGLDYSEEHLQYWRHEHHMLTGNGGTVATIRMMNGDELRLAEHNKFYVGFAESLRSAEESGDVDNVRFVDERWRTELTRFELWLIDREWGELNAEYGYKRDVFADDEVAQFEAELRDGAASA